MSRFSSRMRVILGVLAAAFLMGAALLSNLAITSVRRGKAARERHAEVEAMLPQRSEDRWVRRPARGVDAPREARLEAGRRVVERGGELLGAEWKISRENGAPYFVTTRRLPDGIAAPWIDAVAGATDERLPEPSAEVRAWMDERGPALRAFASEIAAGPPPQWEQDYRWDTTREAKLADVLARHFELLAATHAEAGEHAESEALLDAAWTLRAGIARLRPSDLGDFTLLGALRCTRVRDEAEWLLRLESVNVRAEEASDLLHRAAMRLRRAHSHEPGVPAWAVSLLRAPAEMEAATDAENANESATILLELDPCAEPIDAVPPTWKRDHAIAQWRPLPGRAQVAWDLVTAAEGEIPLRLTCAVLRVRAGGPPGDPCDAITSERSGDGRTTLRWATEPHPLAAKLGVVAPREFTME